MVKIYFSLATYTVATQDNPILKSGIGFGRSHENHLGQWGF